MLACFFVFRTVFQKKAKGFTLLEIILSIALIGILAASSLFALQNFQINNDLDAALANIIQSLRRAQLLSESVSGDSKWGVKIFSDKVVVFKGDNYTERDSSRDEIVEFSSPLSTSGLGEIIFDKFSGEPSATGLITIIAASGATREVDVQSKGQLSY